MRLRMIYCTSLFTVKYRLLLFFAFRSSEIFFLVIKIIYELINVKWKTGKLDLMIIAPYFLYLKD